jgi:hypothetical protein
MTTYLPETNTTITHSDVPSYEMTQADHKQVIERIFMMIGGDRWYEMTPREIATCLSYQVKNDKLLFDLHGIMDWLYDYQPEQSGVTKL